MTPFFPARLRIVATFAAVALAFAILSTSLTGCDTFVSDAEVDQAIAQVDAKRTDLNSKIEKAQTEEERAKLNVELQAYNLAAQSLVDIREGLRRADASAQSQAQLVTTIGSAVPVPFVNTAVALLGGSGLLTGVFGWLGRMKWSKAFRQVVQSFDSAKAKNPALDAALTASKDMLKAKQDLTTQALVDKVRE